MYCAFKARVQIVFPMVISKSLSLGLNLQMTLKKVFEVSNENQAVHQKYIMCNIKASQWGYAQTTKKVFLQNNYNLLMYKIILDASFPSASLLLKTNMWFWYCTWVVVENDVEEILVPPCDVVLVLLVKGMEHVFPWQASGNHAILLGFTKWLGYSNNCPELFNESTRMYSWQGRHTDTELFQDTAMNFSKGFPIMLLG